MPSGPQGRLGAPRERAEHLRGAPGGLGNVSWTDVSKFLILSSCSKTSMLLSKTKQIRWFLNSEAVKRVLRFGSLSGTGAPKRLFDYLLILERSSEFWSSLIRCSLSWAHAQKRRFYYRKQCKFVDFGAVERVLRFLNSRFLILSSCSETSIWLSYLSPQSISAKKWNVAPPGARETAGKRVG